MTTRRQFLKYAAAIPVVAMLPTGYTPNEVEFTVSGLEARPDNITTFASHGLVPGDYLQFSGGAKENNGVYVVTEISGGNITIK